MDYKQYLKTAHWQTVREQALDFAEHRCQLCNGYNSLNVHHNTYQNIWSEKYRDLIVLCDSCHKRFHKIVSKEFEDIPDEKELRCCDMWPVILMDDRTYRKGPRAEIVGRAG